MTAYTAPLERSDRTDIADRGVTATCRGSSRSVARIVSSMTDV